MLSGLAMGWHGVACNFTRFRKAPEWLPGTRRRASGGWRARWPRRNRAAWRQSRIALGLS
jgi:hypothetical protein